MGCQLPPTVQVLCRLPARLRPGWDASHRSPGAPSFWSPAVAVRGTRRLPLPSLRHQHRPRTAGLPGGPAPSPRPRRGPHQSRERHRLGRLPSREYAINQAWVQIAAVAADLTCWLQLLALDGDLAKAEPKMLRFRMLHLPARLARSGRRRPLQLPRHWPWVAQICDAFHRIMIIPAPT